MVSAATFNNNGCSLQILVAGFKDTKMWSGKWGMVCEFMLVYTKLQILLIHRRT